MHGGEAGRRRPASRRRRGASASGSRSIPTTRRPREARRAAPRRARRGRAWRRRATAPGSPSAGASRSTTAPEAGRGRGSAWARSAIAPPHARRCATAAQRDAWRWCRWCRGGAACLDRGHRPGLPPQPTLAPGKVRQERAAERPHRAVGLPAPCCSVVRRAPGSTSSAGSAYPVLLLVLVGLPGLRVPDLDAAARADHRAVRSARRRCAAPAGW